MVLSETVYSDPNFWGVTGIKYAWGYGADYRTLFKNQTNTPDDPVPVNGRLRFLYDKIKNGTFTNAKVLELGGAIGRFSEVAKAKFPQITYDIIDVSTWCQSNVLPTVDNFILGNAVTLLPNRQIFKNNSYDVVISHQSLECFTDSELAIIIPELNRISRVQQIHVLTNPAMFNEATVTEGAYNAKTLAQWSTMGFESGTILLDPEFNEVVV